MLCVGLPAAYHADGRAAPQRPPCVLERLCELHDGLVVEAKGIKQHYFKPYIQKLFEKQVLNASPTVCFRRTSIYKHISLNSNFKCLNPKQILKGNEEHLTELLDPQNFIENK